jgi:protein AATF/BFR2
VGHTVVVVRVAADRCSMKEQMIPILNKWSTKIQAATLSVGGKAAGSSKFLQGTKGQGQMGVVEAIEAGLSNRVS